MMMRKTSGRTTSRRETLALAAAATFAASLPFQVAGAASTSLQQAAQSGGLIYGSSAGDEFINDQAFRDLFLREAAILTPEHTLKFDALQPEQGQFNFEPADKQVDLARSLGLLVHGHTLFWNDWPPPWLKQLSANDVRRVFDSYLDRVVPHFAGRLHSWDVVNEPFWLGRDKPGTFRPGVWYNALGEEYIFRAFERAAELDPQAKLVLNEAWTERTDPVGLAVRRSLLTLIDRMQDRGIKLDAIGLQAHLMPSVTYDDESFIDFLHEIEARRLDIFLTELDVDDRSFQGNESAIDKAVAARTAGFLKASMSVPAVKMIITWGLTDRYTWWRDPSIMAAHGLTRLPRPLPFDEMLQKKPMWFGMADAFSAKASRHG